MSRKSFLGVGMVLLAGVLSVSGCVVEDDTDPTPTPPTPPTPPNPPTPPAGGFDPRGTDVSLHADWQIDGAGATDALCATAGIANVRIRIAADSDSSGTNAYDLVTVGCGSGKYDSPMPVLKAGRYRASLAALSASGATLASSPFAALDASTGADATIATVSFEVEEPPPPIFDPRGSDVVLHAEWQVNGVNADRVLCMQAGIGQVRIDISASDDPSGANAVALTMLDCGEGKYDSPGPVLRAGRYHSSLVALDAAGMPVGASPFAVLDVTTVDDARLATVNFEVEMMPDMTGLLLNLRWDTTPGPTMTDADCATAGVARMAYVLETAGPSPMIVSMAEAVTCGAALSIPDLVAGEYSLYFEGETAAGAKSWMGVCAGLMVLSGEIAEYDCFADYVGP